MIKLISQAISTELLLGTLLTPIFLNDLGYLLMKWYMNFIVTFYIKCTGKEKFYTREIFQKYKQFIITQTKGYNAKNIGEKTNLMVVF